MLIFAGNNSINESLNNLPNLYTMSAKPLNEVSYYFAVRIAKLSQKLQNERNETVLSSKILDCGTAIGFHLSEAEEDPNRDDYSNMMELAYKEAKQTLYWLKIIEGTGWIPETLSFGLKTDCEKLIDRIQLAKSGINT
jgi:four helix bundle protein